MILSREAVLALIGQLVEFIAPVPREVEPGGRGVGGAGGGAEDVGGVVVGVGVGVEGRVPEGAAVGGVVQEAEGEDVGVGAGGGVHGVGAGGGVDDGLGGGGGEMLVGGISLGGGRRRMLGSLPVCPFSRWHRSCMLRRSCARSGKRLSVRRAGIAPSSAPSRRRGSRSGCSGLCSRG